MEQGLMGAAVAATMVLGLGVSGARSKTIPLFFAPTVDGSFQSSPMASAVPDPSQISTTLIASSPTTASEVDVTFIDSFEPRTMLTTAGMVSLLDPIVLTSTTGSKFTIDFDFADAIRGSRTQLSVLPVTYVFTDASGGSSTGAFQVTGALEDITPANFVVGVTLPETAPLFGIALLALGSIGYARRRASMSRADHRG